MRHELTFAGKPLSDFGVYVSGSGIYNSPERAYEKVDVAGRDGAVLISEKRLLNVELIYPAFMYANFKENMRLLRSYLLSRIGYQRLEDTYHPDEFRLACYAGGLDVETEVTNRMGSFDLVFDCKPQRYLTSGETSQTFTSAGTIENPSYMASAPLIRAYGEGTLTINDQSLTITDADEYTDIDCDAMECFKGTVNCNGFVELADFPTLAPGENAISFTGLTRVDITPRWWCL